MNGFHPGNTAHMPGDDTYRIVKATAKTITLTKTTPNMFAGGYATIGPYRRKRHTGDGHDYIKDGIWMIDAREFHD